MVKVKIIKTMDADTQRYVGGAYDAFRIQYPHGAEYIVNVADNAILCLKSEDVEEIHSDLTCAAEEFNKDINMKDIMDGLGIGIGDIVRVNESHVMCNERHELVTLDCKYSTTIPGLILGMVSGKYGYEVFSSKHKVRGKENTKVPLTYV